MHRRTIALPLVLAGMMLLQNEPLSNAAQAEASRSSITFAQPAGPTCDVDVLFGGKPAFRLLVPEHLAAQSADGPLNVPRFIHLLKGRWTTRDGELEGRAKLNDQLACSVRLQPAGGEVLIALSVTNLSEKPLRNLRANICAGVNRLPDRAAWSNRRFIPDTVPLDRDRQGQYWYEQATPKNLQAWMPQQGWKAMHEHPANPDAKKIDRYHAVLHDADDVRACAVESLDGQLFFQAWNAPCHYIAPFPGNACMHLLPLLADRLDARQSITIHGLAGIHPGSRAELTKKLEKFIKSH